MADPAGLPDAAAALVLACLAVITWRSRRRLPALATALSLVFAAAATWSTTGAIALGSATSAVTTVALLAALPTASLGVAAFAGLAMRVHTPHATPSRRVVAGLLAGPAVLALAAATNPWHHGMLRAAGSHPPPDLHGWRLGPVAQVGFVCIYAALVVAVLMVGSAWWRSRAIFRGDRRALLVAVLVPALASIVYAPGGISAAGNPTPLLLAGAGTLVTYAIFEQDLLALAPVARSVIIDQIGDPIVAISPSGRVLDLNPAAVALVRSANPDAPATLIGASESELFGRVLTNGQQTDISVALPAGRSDFHVRTSRLVDRHRRTLGTVLVARDVTDSNAQTRRLSVANARLVRQLETIERLRSDLVELASRDPLTGLHNRRYLTDRFGSLLAAAERSGEPLTVILIDVDRFKEVNDRYGHLIGDEVLIALAHRVREHAPPGALVARWGGEEFFLALPGADAATGVAGAENLRARCERDGIAVAGPTISCTLSIGVASYPTSGTTMNDLFHAADTTLYEAKNSGRNTVKLHTGTHTAAGRDADDLADDLADDEAGDGDGVRAGRPGVSQG